MSTDPSNTPPQVTTEPATMVKPAWYKRPPIIATIAVALIAVLVAVGLAWKTQADTKNAREQYQTAQAGYQQTLTKLDQTKTQAGALLDLAAQRVKDTDIKTLAGTVEEAGNLKGVEVQDASTLGREQAKEATNAVKAAQEQALSVLDKLAASFKGVCEEVAAKATGEFEQAVKNLNEAIEQAGKANREGVEKEATDKLDAALQEAKVIDQSKPETLEAVADIETAFTRADEASKSAKALNEATKAVNDAAKAKAEAQQAQSSGGYEQTYDGGYSGNGYSGGYSDWTAGGNSDSGSNDVCGGGQYCYNSDHPEWIQSDQDGSWHHQVQPDDEGNWTNDHGCVAGCN
jgi:tetratricopeptide (TPR) repeat protein